MAVAGHVAFVVLFIVYVVAVLIADVPTSTPAWFFVAIVLTGVSALVRGATVLVPPLRGRVVMPITATLNILSVGCLSVAFGESLPATPLLALVPILGFPLIHARRGLVAALVASCVVPFSPWLSDPSVSIGANQVLSSLLLAVTLSVGSVLSYVFARASASAVRTLTQANEREREASIESD